MAQRSANYPLYIDQVATATNPTSGTVMADTAQLGYAKTKDDTTTAYYGGEGLYEVLVTASASAAAVFTLQRRNTANDANVGDTLTFRVAAGSTVSVPFRLEARSGERFRVVMGANLTGDAEASITAQRVA